MMRNTKGIRGITRALGTSRGLARVLAATAVCGAAVVGAAPAAAAGEDPGGVSSCPKGSLATSAIGSYVGVAVPVGAEGPSGAGSAAEAVGQSGTTSEVPMFGELVGRACYQRNGGTATMRFRWSSVGRVQTGTFVYQLFDCTTGHTSAGLTRRLGYETPTGTSGHAEATVKVNPAHKYRMRISGGGSYERAPDGVYGLAGYWSSEPPQGSPKWQGETTCA
jgi:hypothetical protein